MLAESAFITEYLVEHYGGWLCPKRWKEGKDGLVGGETEEWLRYRYYMHYAEGSLMSLLLLALFSRSTSFNFPSVISSSRGTRTKSFP